MSAFQHFDQWVLTHDALRRRWLSQSALAWLLMGAGVLAMQYAAWQGKVQGWVVIWWGSVTLGGLALAYLSIRWGWSRRWRDPALTMPQLGYAITCAAVGYGMAGPMRGGVLPPVIVVLLFGMYNLRTRAMLWLSAYTLVAFGAVMVVMATRNPEVFVPVVEVAHFAMLGAMLPAVWFYGVQLSRVRTRLAEHKSALGEAKDEIRRIAIRDEVTGLFNQRHMRTLVEAELKRLARSGPVFSVARLDLDPAAQGECWLKAVAALVGGMVRRTDMPARCECHTLWLLLPQTGQADAGRLLERVRRRVRRLSAPEGVTDGSRATVSIGYVQGQVDDTLDDLLQRLAQACEQARQAGGDRVVYGEPG